MVHAGLLQARDPKEGPSWGLDRWAHSTRRREPRGLRDEGRRNTLVQGVLVRPEISSKAPSTGWRRSLREVRRQLLRSHGRWQIPATTVGALGQEERPRRSSAEEDRPWRQVRPGQPTLLLSWCRRQADPRARYLQDIAAAFLSSELHPEGGSRTPSISGGSPSGRARPTEGLGW